MKERRKLTVLGRKTACGPKGEYMVISKAELEEGSEEVKEGIGLNGTKGMMRRLSRDSGEICAP